MPLFKAERAAVVNATEVAKTGINTSLLVASAAIVIAVVALVMVVSRG